jgi:hypothetical protein
MVFGSSALATGTRLNTLMPLRSTNADVIIRIELSNLISTIRDRLRTSIGTNGHFLQLSPKSHSAELKFVAVLHDGRHLPEEPTPEHLRLGRQAPRLIVVQPETLSAELLPKHSVLFAEVIDRVTLLLAQPTGNGKEQQSKWVEGPAHWASMAARVPATGTATCTI